MGTGIGLYMSYDIIVNHMHGKLYANNTENGAKFSIEIPVERRGNQRRTFKDGKVDKEKRETDRRVNG